MSVNFGLNRFKFGKNKEESIIEERQHHFKLNDVAPNRYYDLQKSALKIINDNVVRYSSHTISY